MGSLLSVIVRQTTSRHVVLRPCASLDRGDDRKASRSKKKSAVRRAANVPLRGIAPSRWSDLIDLPLKKQVHYLLPHACRAEKPDNMRTASGSKKTAVRRAANVPLRGIAPSRWSDLIDLPLKTTSALLTTSRMSGEQPDDMRTASSPRSDIAPLSGGFVKAKPRE